MAQFLLKLLLNRDFLLCTTISTDLTAEYHSLYVKESESEILERSRSEILVRSESDILPLTPQPCSKQTIC